MVFDCFTFFDELDLLEFRLRHLWDSVDFFVICESNLTFSGRHKELLFAQNSGRFAWAMHKIKYVVCDTLIADVNDNDRWHNEEAQRNYMLNAVTNAKEGDTIIIGDIDEFPALDAIEVAKNSGKNCVCLMEPHCYFLDRKANTFVWHGSCIVPYRHKMSAQDVRQRRTSGEYITLEQSGWHFSYTGGIESIQKKLSSFSHSEFDTQFYKDASKLWKDISEDRIFLDGIPLVPVHDIELPTVMLHARKTHPNLFHPTDRRTPPRVFDCFMFWKELDLLELRLRHLYEHVDKFVIVESPFTFTGKPKPLYYLENKERFQWASDKIEHVLTDFQPQVDNAWWNESAQRNNIELGLYTANSSDIVLISDVDEIPDINTLKDACKWVFENNSPSTITMEKCYYKLNNFMTGQEPGVEPHAPWNMFVIALKHHLKRRRPQEMRDAHNGLNQFQGKGGWHFSFMGGADTIKDKIQAFSHTEYNTEDVIDNISTKVAELKSDVFNRGFIFESKPIEPGLLPDYVYKNLEYYKQIGLIN
jgi:beta-1,4-mannosyl-glycoprotein beta-1,4-N-acetylglucosaminyltransferase